MKAHELQTAPKRSKGRVGRGIAAGQGKTAGRGTKGQGARAGSNRKPGFEGGQNPLMQRIPKLRGFKSHRRAVETVYTGQLDAVKGTVDNYSLFEAGLVSTPYTVVKLISRGDVTSKVTVHLQRASKTALEAVAKAGGTFTVTEQIARIAKKTDEEK